MQSICRDIAHMVDWTYVILVDRYSNWPSVHMMKCGGADDLIKALKGHFAIHGVPDILSSDVGTEYSSTKAQDFAFAKDLGCPSSCFNGILASFKFLCG